MDGYVTIGTELDTSGLEKKLDQIVSLMEKKGEEAANKATQKMSKALILGTSVMTNVVGKVMNAVGNSLSGAISRVDVLNNFPNVMSNLGISSKDAGESIDYLSEKLIGLPTTLDEGTSAVQRLTSANGNVKASTEMFLAMNNAILAGGASAQLQSAAIEQLSQAYAKGKPDMQDWRTMIQAMPAQLTQAAKAMGYIDANALGEALRSGSVSMNEFMATLVKLNKEGIDGFASFEEQAKDGTQGIATSIKNLKTSIVRAVAEVLQTIGQANIASFFQSITIAIKNLIPYIAAFVKSFMVAFSTIVSVIGKIGKFFGNIFGSKGKKDNIQIATSYEGIASAIGDVGSVADETTGSAKKLKKELAGLQGFDEMNILQAPSDTASAGGGTGAGGIGDIGDLGALGDINFDNVGKGMKNLKSNVDEVTASIWGLIGAATVFKTLKWLDKIGAISMSFGEIARVSIGIGIAIAGVVLIIQGLIDYLNDPSWENFGKIIIGIGLTIAGIAIAFGAWPIAIAGAFVAIIGIVIKYWDEIKAFFQKGIDWLAGKSDWVHETFGDTIGNIYDTFVKFLQNVLDGFDQMFSGAKEFLDGIIDFVKGVFSGNWEQAWEGIKKMFSGALNAMIGTLRVIFGGIITIVVEIWNSMINNIKGIWNGLISFIKGAINTIGKFFSDLGRNAGEAVAGAFKGVINAVLATIEYILNTPIKAINALIKAVNTLPGVNLGRLSTFKLPRLAQGGIVNNPGPGVMMGGYVAGERGPEAVIPLDDETMNRLGLAIARNMSINNDNKIYLNARQIARQMNITNAESDFAFNR